MRITKIGVVRYALGGVYGLMLGVLGYNFSTWQFWAMMGLMVVMQLIVAIDTLTDS